MMSWLAATPAIFSALALVTLPGLPLAWLLRFRGLTLVAASVAASFALIGLTSILAPLVGVRWGVLPIIVASLLMALLILSLRRFIATGTDAPVSQRASALVAGGAVLTAAVMIGSAVLDSIGSPENISQTYDGVFHLNAAAQVLSTGDASPFHMNLAAPSQATIFYPTLWHASVAIVSQMSGASIPVATNALAVITASWVWPISILFFSRPFFVRRPSHLIMGGLLAALFTAFPYLLLTWGVLYPNLLSTALIPVSLGFIYLALRARTVGSGLPLLSIWVALFGALGAAILAHPNALFGVIVFLIPMLAVVANDVRISDRTNRTKLLRWGFLVAALVSFILIWATITTTESRRYSSGLSDAFMDAATNAPLIETRSWFLTVLVVSGILVLLIRRRHRWLIGSYAITVALYSVTVGIEGPLRDFITGAWYNDAARVAALLPIAAIPLAGAAAAQLLDLVTDGLRGLDKERFGNRIRQLLPVLGAIIVFALVFTGARGLALRMQTDWMHGLYVVSDDSNLLSSDELALLDRIDSEVPPNALIAGDPWTGTGLALAFSGRPVLFPHLKGSYGEDAFELAAWFRALDTEACPLLNELDVEYILDFGGPRYDIGDPEASEGFDGLRNLSSSLVLDEVDREGIAVLYRVDCG